MTGTFNPELCFQSSGTTESGRSRHFVRDRNIYETVATRIFQNSYGPLEDFTILALLPSYLEQGDSSLIHMIRLFILKTKDKSSGFYRYDFTKLSKEIEKLFESSGKILLWGVTYALLDFAEQSAKGLSAVLSEQSNFTVMETGGMKGRREEMVRSEVHNILKEKLNCNAIHSEYGMTEMLSQAYSQGDGVFDMGHTLRILSFDVMDPLCYTGDHRTGRCHVVDLANLDSCSFIATDDLCKTAGRKFEIMGRVDNADIRGCNLLYLN